jgi:hypothetical protein
MLAQFPAFAPRAIALAFLVGLAACGSDFRPVANARFGPPDRIAVFTRSAEPLEEVELVAPDGSGVTAERLSADAPLPTRLGIPGVAVGAEGGSASGVNPGISIGLPILGLFGRREAPPLRGEALIVLPDPNGYRRHWRDWKLLLRFGRNDRLTIPAPDPAAAP